MSEDVFLCFECGQRNRVPSKSARSLAKCGKCGASLFPGESRSSARGSTERNPGFRREPWSAGATDSGFRAERSAPPPRSTGSGIPWRRLLLVGLVGGGLWLYLDATDGVMPGRPEPTPQVQTYTPPASTRVAGPAPQSLPPAVARPSPGVMWNWTGRPPQAPLEIVTSAGSDYYLKLVDSVTGDEAMGIYVYGGRRIEVDVPLGRYRIRYAAGQTWRGQSNLFGPNGLTTYSEAQSVLNFEISGGYINGYTVELINQIGGNLSTRSIGASQF